MTQDVDDAFEQCGRRLCASMGVDPDSLEPGGTTPRWQRATRRVWMAVTEMDILDEAKVLDPLVDAGVLTHVPTKSKQ